MPMTRFYTLHCIWILMLTAVFAGTSHAAPNHPGPPDHRPPHAGNHGHRGGHETRYRHARDHAGDADIQVFFNARRRDIIRDYYASRFNAGFCPPGLAKKHNGCMPPGQAKKWRIGYPLPGDVAYYPLPRELARQLGYDNPAYKLVRVGVDILRIAVGTGIVVEAVQDLASLD